MTLNDLECQRSLSLNDIGNVQVKCTKFEASIFDIFNYLENILILEKLYVRVSE